MVRLGEPAILPLINLLSDPVIEVAHRAAIALGQLGSRQAVEPLIRTLQSPDKLIRWSVIEALGQLADERAIPSLLIALQDPELHIGEATGVALVKIGAPALFPIIRLIPTIPPETLTPRILVAAVLGELADRRAVSSLVTLLGDTNENVRATAATALGNLEDTQGVEPLISALDDPNTDVRSNAAIALGRLGDSRALPALEILQKADDNEGTWDGEAVSDVAGKAIISIESKNLHNVPHDK